MVTTLQKPAI